MNRMTHWAGLMIAAALLGTAGCHSHDTRTVEHDRVIVHDDDHYHHNYLDYHDRHD